jgi:hypothetical protein
MLFTKYAKYSSRRFCPVCKKNGKSEAEYTSHNTRDENDNPICPILLDIVCNYCGENGHIASKCSRNTRFVQQSYITLPPIEPKIVQDNFPPIEPKILEDNFPPLTSKKPNSASTTLQYSNVAAIAKQEVKNNDTVKKTKHWSPTCEEIETRLRKIVLADEYRTQHANNIYGRTIYLTRDQVREKINSGCNDIDLDKVYVIDEHDNDYDYCDPYDDAFDDDTDDNN